MQGDIAELLRACRERKGWSQKELADRLHIDRTIVSKIETRAIKEPSYAIVKDWARLTGCEDMIGMHLTGGRDSWKKLSALEAAAKTARAALDAINFMKRRKGVMKHDATASAGELRGRLRSGKV